MTRIFRHYVPTSLMFLALSESLMFLLPVYVVQSVELAYFGQGVLPGKSGGSTFAAASLVTFVMLLSLSSAGLYQRGLREQFPGIALRLGFSFLLGAVVMTLVFNLLPELDIGSRSLYLALGMSLIAVSATRLIFYSLTDHEALRRRILVLGAGDQASLIERQLRRKADRRGMEFVGFVHSPHERNLITSHKLLSLKTTLLDLVQELEVDELVVAMDNRRKNFPIDQLIECKMSGVRVVDLLSFLERQTGKIQIETLYPGSLVFLDGFSHAVLRRFSKRAADVAMSVFMLLMTLPVMLLAAVVIWGESGGKGPVLYKQVSVGRNGKHFQVLKFRSMRTDAESDGVARWASTQDSRITRVGGFIRKTRIDELPQLLNVLRGDMSFVGPRPERPDFVKDLAEQMPYYAMRHRVNPGITGWAQVSYPYGASLKDAKEKLQYDLYYIKNFSLFLDLMIIVQTIQVVLWYKGSR